MDEEHNKRIRLFTGLSLDPEVRDYVAGISSDLSEGFTGVRWVPIENLHVTLKFLGWCDPEIVPRLLEVMEEAASLLPLELNVGGVGGFPSHGSARVIWVGAEEVTGKAVEVFKRMERGMAKFGFKREKRRYHPHITIGRARKKPVKIPEEVFRSFESRMILEIKDLVLFRSELKKTGAEYSIVARVCP